MATYMTPRNISLMQYQKVDKVIQEYKGIFSSPVRGTFALSRHAFNFSNVHATLHNIPIYQCYVMENKEIKWNI